MKTDVPGQRSNGPSTEKPGKANPTGEPERAKQRPAFRAATRPRWWRGLTPVSGLLVIAGLLVLAHLFTRLGGWREHTTFLSLTPTDANDSTARVVTLGTAYIVTYLATAIVAPMLAIAALLLELLRKVSTKYLRLADPLRLNQSASIFRQGPGV